MLHKEKNSSPKRKKVKQGIAEAALRIFGKKGYASTTIADVAQEAGVATGTVYLYFKNKDELFLYTVDMVVSTMIEKIHKHLMNVDNPLEKIFRFFDMSLDLFAEDPGVTRMISIDVQRIDSLKLEPDIFPAFFKYSQYIHNLCVNAVDKGFMRECDVDALANMIFACIDYLIRIWVHSNYEIDMKAIKHKMLNILIYGIIRY